MPPPALAPDTAAQAMRGVVGTVPLKDFGALSSIFSSWKTRFLSNPDTTGTARDGGECRNGTTTIAGSVTSKLTDAPAGLDCECASETDSTGKQLWQHDHDGDPATPDRCAGVAFSTGYLNTYTSYAYDGVLAYAHAAHFADNPSGIPEALTSNVSFEGVTGWVEFTNTREKVGDREVGVAYEVMNHEGGKDFVNGLAKAAQWTVDQGLQFSQNRSSWVWPTKNNVKPVDVVGSITCAVGFGLSVEGVSVGSTCVRCSAGTYSPDGRACLNCGAGRWNADEGAAACQGRH